MKKMDVHIVGLGNLGSAFLNGLKGLDANIYLYEESNEVRQSIQKNYSISPEESLTAIRGGVLLCLLYTSPSPRDRTRSRMPSSA